MPILSLAVLFFGPLLLLAFPRLGAVLTLLSGATAWILDGTSFGLPALALGLAGGLVLHLTYSCGWPRCWSLALWIGLCLAPLWGPGSRATLAERGPTPEPPSIAWTIWPAVGLTGADWDPARRAPLYESWGAQTALPTPGAGLHVVVLAALAAALYSWRTRRVVRPQELDDSDRSATEASL